MNSLIHFTELNDDLYAVQVDKENCRCNTCLQVAYFVLDSAKFCGNINCGPEQLFEEVIKDQGFFDRYKDCVLVVSINEDRPHIQNQHHLPKPQTRQH
ncbi:MAG: hypothetical protein EZS28_004010 [Streblomastix strix]|uniref:Uncharacterized protein n=1 Tax=Streblomastix strix TaxID=222440 RepID=A0A5J4WZV8_9EUKA|nr:MAG: hypothetical protein EZS28_004010 [Streblomastix strix]